MCGICVVIERCVFVVCVYVGRVLSVCVCGACEFVVYVVCVFLCVCFLNLCM